MSPERRVLTGITTSGTPHLGNYVGAIRPAIAASRLAEVESYYFLADYHALVKCQEPARVQQSTREIAASWLACGLDPESVYFYRQSDIPEIPELTWLLTCVTAKGLLNRAHAYKAASDLNRESGEDTDAGISAGLYMYPVLMAADILLFNAHQVPVGRDQIQHIEMARDIGQRFNHLFGAGRELFTLPEAAIEDNVSTLPGLDGRKMSKSYDNTIPLWLPAPALRKAILGIKTNSQAPGEPKDPEGSHLFSIYQAFASPDETQAMRRAYAEGIAWGEAKERLFERIERELAPMRARYQAWIDDPARLEQVLLAGAEKARARARPFIAQLRSAVGLRRLDQGVAARAPTGATEPGEAAASVKQFRESDGAFRFRIEFGGRQSLVGGPYASGKEAGQLLASLYDTALEIRATGEESGHRLELLVGASPVARTEPYAGAGEAEADLGKFRAAWKALLQQRDEARLAKAAKA